MLSRRQRNNEASQRSYEKRKLLKDSRDYEYEVTAFHSKKEDVVECQHWDRVPEDWLYESGYINDYNKHRLERLKRYIDGKSILRDCGFDGMSIELINGEYVYCGIQDKYYKNKICYSDIGSSLGKIWSLTNKNPMSRLYLYGTSSLQEDAQEIFYPYNPDESNLIFIHHPWSPPDGRSRAHERVITISEQELVPRDYQIKIIGECSENDGIQFIQIPCGLGKTLITGHSLKNKNIPKVIAIAPLKASVENLRRLCGFLPDYPVLLVDSDSGGTTDEAEIKRFMTSYDKYLILSTYESTENILSKIITDFDDTILVVDEAHNLLNNKCLLEFINNTNDSILLSATIPEELYENFDDYTLHQYSWKEAILNGYCVDYRIWLPHLTKREDGSTFVDYTIPEELSIDVVEDSQELYAKALFLINGMLKTGSRRCIVYMSSQEECDRFMKICEIISRKYHGNDIWTEKIDSNVRQEERKRIIQEFQQGEESTLYILTSVRILDEAVDIVRCDSEFISSVGEKSSDIRFTQRAFRGSRLDSKNTYKKNNIFVWATGNENCLGIFEILRDEDPEFHKKVKHYTIDYDRQYLPEVQEEIKKEDKEFNEWFEAKCISLDEKWYLNCEKVKIFQREKGKLPNKRSIDQEERYLGMWLNDQRRKTRRGKKIILSPEKKEKLEEIPGALNTLDNKWNMNYSILKDFVDIYKTLPSNSSINPEEKRSASWLQRQRYLHKRERLSKSKTEMLHEIPGAGALDKIICTIDESIDSLIDFVDKYDKFPSSCSKNKDEQKNGIFYQRLKKLYSEGKLTIEQIKKLKNIHPNCLDKKIKKKSWEDSFTELKDFMEEKNRFPSVHSNNQKEKILANFLDTQKKRFDRGKLLKYREEKLMEIPNSLNICKIRDWKEICDELKSFIKQTGRLPKRNSQCEKETMLGGFLERQYNSYKNGKLSVERYEQIKDILDDYNGKRTPRVNFEDRCNELIIFRIKNERFPSQRSKDEKEKSLGVWLNQQKVKYKKGKLTEHHKKLLEDAICESTPINIVIKHST